MSDKSRVLQRQLNALKERLYTQDFDSLTPEYIQTMLQEFVENDLGLYGGEGGILNIILAPGAYVFWEALQALRAQVPISFVDETSGSYIDKTAAGYGIERKPGVKAKVEITFEGGKDTVIPAGTICVSNSGLCFLTDIELIIGETGNASVTATADMVGSIYNVPARAIVSTQAAVSGVTGLVNADAATGGTDPESDASLFARLDAYRRTPPTSGNERHYHQWALEVNGVGAASVIRTWDGPGTVKVVIADMELHPADEELRKKVADYIETLRPVTAEVTVQSASGVRISVEVTVEAENHMSKSDTEKNLTERMVEYLGTLAFQQGAEVVYNRVLAIVMGLPGVLDCTGLTVNGGTANVPLDASEIPMLGTISVSGILEASIADAT